MEPRALERLAEVTAMRHAAGNSAAGRYGTDELAVGIEVRRGRDPPDTMRDVQRRVAAALRPWPARDSDRRDPHGL